jgi:hypothetical protein
MATPFGFVGAYIVGPLIGVVLTSAWIFAIVKGSDNPNKEILPPILKWPDYIFMLFAGPSVTLLFLLTRRAHVRADRILKGLCLKCGYDMRASPERCPECGEKV